MPAAMLSSLMFIFMPQKQTSTIVIKIISIHFALSLRFLSSVGTFIFLMLVTLFHSSLNQLAS